MYDHNPASQIPASVLYQYGRLVLAKHHQEERRLHYDRYSDLKHKEGSLEPRLIADQAHPQDTHDDPTGKDQQLQDVIVMRIIRMPQKKTLC